MKNQLIFSFLCLYFSGCTWTAKIRVVEGSPAAFRHEFSGMKVITIAPPASSAPLLIADGDWKEMFTTRLQEAFATRQFLAVVNSGNIAAQLEKFRNVGNARPKEESKLAQSIGADGILYVEFTGDPKSECEHTNSKSFKTELCIERSCGERTHMVFDLKNFMSVRTLTIPFKATLVDTRNGMISRMIGTAGELSSTYGSECHPENKVMEYLLQSHAGVIAEQFSPKMGELEVELEAGADGCPDGQQAQAKSLLKDGIGFAMENDFRKAREPWLKALEICGEKAASVHWNLGIYYWMAGDLKTADAHFKKATTLDGNRYRENSRHREALDKFRAARAKG